MACCRQQWQLARARRRSPRRCRIATDRRPPFSSTVPKTGLKSSRLMRLRQCRDSHHITVMFPSHTKKSSRPCQKKEAKRFSACLLHCSGSLLGWLSCSSWAYHSASASALVSVSAPLHLHHHHQHNHPRKHQAKAKEPLLQPPPHPHHQHPQHHQYPAAHHPHP